MSAARRNYPLLLISQFLSALSDNALLAVILGQLTYLQQAGAITEAELRTRNTIYTSLLFVPYVLLAPLAGYFNDRYAKTRWLVGGNLLKIAGTLICAWGLGQGPAWQGIGYAIVGVGACFYSPAKYGILPEILPRARLVKANGTIELLTLMAILFGMVGGAILSDLWRDRVLASYTLLTFLFSVSLMLNLFMTTTPSQAGLRLAESVRDFGRHSADLFRSPRLARMLIGTASFWFCGAALKINFQPWGLHELGLVNNTEISLLGLWLSLGVMLGSIAAGQLYAVGDLRRTRVYGLALAVALALLFTVAQLAFWQGPVVSWGPVSLILPVGGLLIATGAAGGLFLIPLNAALQAESDPAKLGKTIAVQNLVNNIAMCAAGAFVFGAVQAGLSPSGVFLGLALALAAVVAGLRLRLPASPAGRARDGA